MPPGLLNISPIKILFQWRNCFTYYRMQISSLFSVKYFRITKQLVPSREGTPLETSGSDNRESLSETYLCQNLILSFFLISASEILNSERNNSSCSYGKKEISPIWKIKKKKKERTYDSLRIHKDYPSKEG